MSGEASILDDNQRMEIRSILKEVVGLIYEWDVDEENKNEDENVTGTTTTMDSQTNGHISDKLPERLINLCSDANNYPIVKECNESSCESTMLNENCISKCSTTRDTTSSDVCILESSTDDIVDDYNKAISLTKRRLQLMENLGFKVITRLDICSNIVEYAKEIGDMQTVLAYLEKGCALAKILYGGCSHEVSKWKLEIDKVNNNILDN